MMQPRGAAGLVIKFVLSSHLLPGLMDHESRGVGTWPTIVHFFGQLRAGAIVSVAHSRIVRPPWAMTKSQWFAVARKGNESDDSTLTGVCAVLVDPAVQQQCLRTSTRSLEHVRPPCAMTKL
jgi:hypothetical protein